MSRPGSPRPPALAFVTALAAAAVALRLGAVGDLSAPPVGSLDGLSAWADARPPGAMAVALARVGAESVAWYLLAVAMLHALAGVPGLAASGHLAHALSTPAVARLVRAGLGAGLVISTTATTGPGDRDGTAAMTPVPAAVGGRAEMAPEPPPAGTATMRPERATPPETATDPPATDPPATVRPATWTVTEGESFWAIAVALTATDLGRTPTTAEVDPVWRALIDANRHRLVDPGDPDRIVPGQVFEVPAA